MEVCPFSRRMISPLPRLNPYPPHYRAAFAFSTFLYPHRRQHSLQFACPEGQRYGLTLFHFVDKRELDSVFSPTVFCPCALILKKSSQPRTFWFKPVSIFGLSSITTFIDSSLVLIISLSLAPLRIDACSRHLPSRVGAARGPGYIVPAASHEVVASLACAGRLLVTEHQVPSPFAWLEQSTKQLPGRTQQVDVYPLVAKAHTPDYIAFTIA